MSQDIEKHRRWIREGASGRSAIIYYLGKALIQELGEEKGTAVIIKQIEEMGHSTGRGIKKSYNSRGFENSLENFFTESDSGKSVYDFAWGKSGPKIRTDSERVFEFSYCPIAEGFKNLGDEAVRIGELFCDHIDNAIIQGYNPDYECIRESSLNLDGLCRHHFRKKK